MRFINVCSNQFVFSERVSKDMKLSFRNKKLSKCWGKYSKVFAPVDRVRDHGLTVFCDFPCI